MACERHLLPDFSLGNMPATFMAYLAPTLIVLGEQPSNILDVSVTFDVSQPERSREVSEEQPENM